MDKSTIVIVAFMLKVTIILVTLITAKFKLKGKQISTNEGFNQRLSCLTDEYEEIKKRQDRSDDAIITLKTDFKVHLKGIKQSMESLQTGIDRCDSGIKQLSEKIFEIYKDKK